MFKCSECQRIFAPPPDGVSPVRATPRAASPSNERLPLRFAEDSSDPSPERTEEEPYHSEPYEETDTEEEETARRISVFPVVIVVAMIVMGYALLARAMYVDPKWARSWLDAIPLVGRVPFADTLARDVRLELLTAKWQRLRDGRLVLVVTGSARNESAFPLANVQIEVSATTEAGAAGERRVVFCGHPVPNRIGSFGLQQLLLLVSIKPPRHWTLEPGNACPFTAILPTTAPDAVQGVEAHVVAALRKPE